MRRLAAQDGHDLVDFSLVFQGLQVVMGGQQVNLRWQVHGRKVDACSGLFDDVRGQVTVATEKQNCRLSGTTAESLPIFRFTRSTRAPFKSGGMDATAISTTCMAILISCIESLPAT